MAFRLLPICSAVILVAFADEPLPTRTALIDDDECIGNGGEDCSLNALQLKGHAVADVEEITEATLSKPGECGDCMMNNGNSLDASLGASPLRHYAQNCWHHCNKRSGSCNNFCGPGNACCRYGYPGPAECHNIGFWPVLSYHTCVVGSVPPPPATTPAPEAEEAVDTENLKTPDNEEYFNFDPTKKLGAFYNPQVVALSRPSSAPLQTFYIYRAMGSAAYPPENVNAASAGGVMWYLHNEVVIFTPRKFGISRIMRFKVQYRTPEPLWRQHIHFGTRYAFDSGKCTGPGKCEEDYARYGYFVGCNKVYNWPTPQFADARYYPDAAWYAFPGPCASKPFKEHDEKCIRDFPGGACAGTPTGRGDCTYSYQPAGEVSVDELVGIKNYTEFMAAGGREYIPGLGLNSCKTSSTCDKGNLLSFWDDKHNVAKNKQRVDHLLKIFKDKYPEWPSLPEAPCDFDIRKFYYWKR